jgi:hypothetical protein
MAKIGPDLSVGVNTVDSQSQSKKSPAKGESSQAAGVDRLQLGAQKVSAEDAVRILAERVTSHALDALREANTDVGRPPSLEVPVNAAPEAVAKRVFSFAVSLFEKFWAGNQALGEREARGRFASLMAEALSKASSETENLLRGLRVFVSGEVSSGIEQVKGLLSRLLDEFVEGGLMGFSPGSESADAGEARASGAGALRGREPVFIPRVIAGGQEKVTFFSKGTTGPPSEVVSVGTRAPMLGPSSSAEGGSGLLAGQPSAQQAMKVLGDFIISNFRFIMGESLGETALDAVSHAPPDATLEAAANRVFDYISGAFERFREIYPGLSQAEANEHFARLVGEALRQGVSDTGRFFQSLQASMSGEAAASVEKLKNLLARMMEEFIAEGLKGSSPKTPLPGPPWAEASFRPAEQGQGATLLAPEGAEADKLLPAGRLPQPSQAQLIPPESTILAMAKRSLSKRMYTSSQQNVLSPVIAYRPPLASLVGSIFFLSVLVNYPWELAQMVLYRWWSTPWSVGLLEGLKAALGDGLLILALYAMGCAVFRSRDWVLKPGASGYAFLSLSGMVFAVAAEWHAAAWSPWAYSSIMPLVPVLGVGLMPVLQMMILPPFVVHLTRLWLIRQQGQIA